MTELLLLILVIHFVIGFAVTSSPQRSGRLTPATCRGDKNETGT